MESKWHKWNYMLLYFVSKVLSLPLFQNTTCAKAKEPAVPPYNKELSNCLLKRITSHVSLIVAWHNRKQSLIVSLSLWSVKNTAFGRVFNLKVTQIDYNFKWNIIKCPAQCLYWSYFPWGNSAKWKSFLNLHIDHWIKTQDLILLKQYRI